LSKDFSDKVTDEYNYLPARIFALKGFPYMLFQNVMQAFFEFIKVDDED
jgi:hypothetical protein